MEISPRTLGGEGTGHNPSGVTPRSGFCSNSKCQRSMADTCPAPSMSVLPSKRTAHPIYSLIYVPSWAFVRTVPPTIPHLLLLFSSRKSLLILQLSPTDYTRQNSSNSHFNTISARSPHVNATAFSLKVQVLGACLHNLLCL